MWTCKHNTGLYTKRRRCFTYLVSILEPSTGDFPLFAAPTCTIPTSVCQTHTSGWDDETHTLKETFCLRRSHKICFKTRLGSIVSFTTIHHVLISMFKTISSFIESCFTGLDLFSIIYFKTVNPDTVVRKLQCAACWSILIQPTELQGIIFIVSTSCKSCLWCFFQCRFNKKLNTTRL